MSVSLELSAEYCFLIYVPLVQNYMSPVDFFQHVQYIQHVNSSTMSRVYMHQLGTSPQWRWGQYFFDYILKPCVNLGVKLISTCWMHNSLCSCGIATLGVKQHNIAPWLTYQRYCGWLWANNQWLTDDWTMGRHINNGWMMDGWMMERRSK